MGHVTHKDFGEFTLAASELVAADAWSRIQETAAKQATPPRIAFFAALQVHTPDGDLAIPISHHLG